MGFLSELLGNIGNFMGEVPILGDILEAIPGVGDMIGGSAGAAADVGDLMGNADLFGFSQDALQAGGSTFLDSLTSPAVLSALLTGGSALGATLFTNESQSEEAEKNREHQNANREDSQAHSTAEREDQNEFTAGQTQIKLDHSAEQNKLNRDFQGEQAQKSRMFSAASQSQRGISNTLLQRAASNKRDAGGRTNSALNQLIGAITGK